MKLNNKQQLEYIYPNNLEVIYLLDMNDYLTRTKLSVSNKDEGGQEKTDPESKPGVSEDDDYFGSNITKTQYVVIVLKVYLLLTGVVI